MCRIALIEKKLREKYNIAKPKYTKDIYRVFNKMHERLSIKVNHLYLIYEIITKCVIQLNENRKANMKVDLAEGLRKFKKIFKVIKNA